MLDRQELERAGFGKALRQMPAAVMIVEAPSGKIIFVNREAWQISERVHGQTMAQEPGDYANRYRTGNFEILHPDGRP